MHPMIEQKQETTHAIYDDGGRDIPSELARRLFAAIDANDLDGFDPFIHPDYTFHLADQPPMDWNGNTFFTAQMFAAIPDLTHRIESIVSDGTRVAVRITASGTHAGELFGLPPTGRRVAVASMAMLRVRNDQIIEYRLLFDRYGLLRQLGAV